MRILLSSLFIAPVLKSVSCSNTPFTSTNSNDNALMATEEITLSNIRDLTIDSTLSTVGYTSANCYSVNAPGWYKFACNVMGNGIYQNSSLTANNANCIASGFTNYAGSPIINESDLNIPLTGATASLIWEDAPGLITNISISGDYIQFYVSPNSIREGNAIIAIMSSDNTIMWSWHIWVTTWTLFANRVLIIDDTGNIAYALMNNSIGECMGGTYTYTGRSEERRVGKEC